MQSFRVSRGVRVEVCKANRRGDWVSFTTTKTNTFDEPISRTRSTVVFRDGRWLLRVKPHQVEMFNGLRWVRMK
ncbi:hypothetical protein Enr13x_62210 [Stieleria neptunia]|uniref:Uncharacterized protein n=1 Tax=Stieleria neptunia TaxID=2527979 RepID=A0A518HZN4_9BACT|nr:hypothetical protein [Stieleria neptunia]QDV46312.1 hypothetical protein Enr13x_62210 [Stieleria neptunia]